MNTEANERVQATADVAAERAKTTLDDVSQQIRENPLPAVLVCFVIGYALGKWFR